MRILLVEDDSDIAANISDFLTATGHVVDIAHDGADGLRLAREHAHDLFLLDVNLPVLSGFELCRVLRETLHIEAPILFTTARSALPDKLSGFEAGGWDYLVKPFSLAELDARIRATQLRTSAASTCRLGRSSFRPATRCLTVENTDIQLPRIQVGPRVMWHHAALGGYRGAPGRVGGPSPRAVPTATPLLLTASTAKT